MNKYRPHLYVIPEDDADRQLAEGFVDHYEVADRHIKVMPVAGGWPNVLKTFEEEYVPTLRNYSHAHVVLLIDFDDDIEGRTSRFNEAIPEDVKPRVFVIGGKHDPQSLKRSMTISLTEIGKNLAADCDGDTLEYWNHEQLQHNDSERLRLVQTVKPFLFFAGPDAQV